MAARRLAVGHRDGVRQRFAQRGRLHLQPHRPHELQHLLDDGIGHLRFADDVGDQRLSLGVVRRLAADQAGQHLDAGQRVLDLVGHDRRHLADRRQPVAQPLALLHLLDVGQVLEEQAPRPTTTPASLADQRQAVADHRVGGLQPHLGAAGQRRPIEHAAQHAQDVRVFAQDPFAYGGRYVRPRGSRKMRRASSLMQDDPPARSMARTPLRMLATRQRKNRWTGPDPAAASARPAPARSLRLPARCSPHLDAPHFESRPPHRKACASR